MKKSIITVMVLVLLLSIATVAMAQEEHNWNASLVMGASLSGGDGMGGIGAEILYEFNDNLEVGFHAYAQAEVSKEYVDTVGRAYHMSSGYGTLVIKPKFSIGEMWEIGFPLETGNGLIQYRYNGEYREELRWTDEIIDQVNHSVYSAGIEPKFFLGEKAALTVAAGYRVTGPLRTDLAEEGELNGFWGRFGFSVGF